MRISGGGEKDQKVIGPFRWGKKKGAVGARVDVKHALKRERGGSGKGRSRIG